MIMRLIEPTAGEIYSMASASTRRSPRDAAATQRAAGGLPGSLFVAQPAHARQGHRRRALRNFARLRRADLDHRVADLFEQVGLRRDQMVRFPTNFRWPASAPRDRRALALSQGDRATSRCRRSTFRCRRR
jgi:ABC-type oligopeptide transport system ATPase subunit